MYNVATEEQTDDRTSATEAEQSTEGAVVYSQVMFDLWIAWSDRHNPNTKEKEEQIEVGLLATS